MLKKSNYKSITFWFVIFVTNEANTSLTRFRFVLFFRVLLIKWYICLPLCLYHKEIILVFHFYVTPNILNIFQNAKRCFVMCVSNIFSKKLWINFFFELISSLIQNCIIMHTLLNLTIIFIRFFVFQNVKFQFDLHLFI